MVYTGTAVNNVAANAVGISITAATNDDIIARPAPKVILSTISGINRPDITGNTGTVGIKRGIGIYPNNHAIVAKNGVSKAIPAAMDSVVTGTADKNVFPLIGDWLTADANVDAVITAILRIIHAIMSRSGIETFNNIKTVSLNIAIVTKNNILSLVASDGITNTARCGLGVVVFRTAQDNIVTGTAEDGFLASMRRVRGPEIICC